MKFIYGAMIVTFLVCLYGAHRTKNELFKWRTLTVCFFAGLLFPLSWVYIIGYVIDLITGKETLGEG